MQADHWSVSLCLFLLFEVHNKTVQNSLSYLQLSKVVKTECGR